MAFKIKNIAKWIKILDDLGIDIGDFDIKQLAGLTSGSGLEDILALFNDSEKDVDGGLLEQIIGKEAGSLTDLLGNDDDDDDDDNDNLVSTLLNAVDSDDTPNSGVNFGGLLGSVLGGGDDDDESPLESIIGSIF